MVVFCKVCFLSSPVERRPYKTDVECSTHSGSTMKKKRCYHCKIKKPLSDFHFKNKKQGKRHGVCGLCMRGYRIAHYQANKAETIRRSKRRNAKVLVEHIELIRRYLSEHPCVDCGEDDLLVLQFDHVRGKKRASISEAVRHCWSTKSLIAEIKKCDVRCANCHQRVTIRRSNSVRLAWLEPVS